MTPQLNGGEFVFVTVENAGAIDRSEILCEFKETESTTLVIEKHVADRLQLSYDYVSSWITLQVHSSLSAVGLTAVVASELAKHDISCNVIAASHHDHLFVDTKDTQVAIQVLRVLSESYQ